MLAEIERADAPDSSVVLVFDYPAQVAPRVPVLNVTCNFYPAAQLRPVRASRPIRSLPAPMRCSPKGVVLDQLVTPLYKKINPLDWGTPKLNGYLMVVFVDVERRRHELISSPEQCAEVSGSTNRDRGCDEVRDPDLSGSTRRGSRSPSKRSPEDHGADDAASTS